MERLATLSINDQETIQFAKKKHLTEKFIEKKYAERTTNCITNFSTYHFNNILSSLFIYGINIENQIKNEDNDDQKFPLYLLSKVFRDSEMKKILDEHFGHFLLSGNTLFAQVREGKEAPNSIVTYLYNNTGEIRLVTEEEAKELLQDEGNMKNVYSMTLNKRISIFDYQKGEIKDSEHIKRYINLVMAAALQKLNLKRADIKSGYDDLNKEEMIPVEARNMRGVYFFQSYKFVTGIYENDNIFMKIVPKYRMIREETYYDRYQYLCSQCQNIIEVNTHFAQLCKGRSGITTYSYDRIRIDEVIFKNPIEITFTNPLGETTHLIQYYMEKYKINIKSEVQPIFVRIQIVTNRQTGQKQEKTLYYLPQLLYIAGKFEDETIKIDSVLKMSPTDRCYRDSYIMEKVNRFLHNNKTIQTRKEKSLKQDMNFKPIQTTAYVLYPPALKFDNKNVLPDKNGNFDIQGIKPYRDIEMKSWIFLLLDTSRDEAFEIYKKLQHASGALNIKIPEPALYDIKYQQEAGYYREYFDGLFESLHEQRKQNKFEFIVLISSSNIKNGRRTKQVYSYFKDSLEKSKVTICSQVLIKETAFKARMSYYTYVLFQIWAKRNLEVWGIKTLSRTVQSHTIIAAYAVNHNPSNGKSLTSLCISYDSEFTSYSFFSEYSQAGCSFISNVIGSLFKKALSKYVRDQEKYGDSEKKIKNFVIYREGLNEAQRKMSLSLEMTQIRDTFNLPEFKDKMPDSKICLIFVNNKSETKLYEVLNRGNKSEGIENYSYLNSNLSVGNVPVGSLVESVIVSKDRWEFYLTSAYALSGTSNPTHYVVGFDNTDIDADFIYKMTYHLTYLYYNNNKSVRIPAPLHNIIRRNKFVINHLTALPKNKANFSL